MRTKEILLIALSVVLIVCLVLLGRSCVAERAASPATPAPTAERKPIPTFAPTPTPSPTPEPTPEPTPTPPPSFAEEMGFVFEQPQTHTIPAVQIASVKAVAYSPVRAVVSAPQITRSAPDAEGYVTYEIRYTTTADAHLTMPRGERCDTYYLFAGGYDLVDRDSGAMLNSRGGGTLEGEQTYTRELLLPAGLVRVTEQARCTWDEWQFTEKDGRVTAANQAVVDAHLTVRAPADYDGLLLGLDVANEEKVPDNLFSGGTAAKESPGTWNGYAEDWVFIRADDWLSEQPAEAQVPETAAEEPEEAEPESDAEEAEEESEEEPETEEETDESEEQSEEI